MTLVFAGCLEFSPPLQPATSKAVPVRNKEEMGTRIADYTLCFCEASCGVMEDNSMIMGLTMSGPAYGVRRNINQVVCLNRSQEFC